MRPTYRRGANALEFALTFPVVVLLLFAVMEYGWYFSRQVAVTTAVRDAARFGSMTPRNDAKSPNEVAEEYLIDRLIEQGYTGEVKLDVTLFGAPPQRALRVGVALPHQGLTRVVPIPSGHASVMSIRLEDQPIP